MPEYFRLQQKYDCTQILKCECTEDFTFYMMWQYFRWDQTKHCCFDSVKKILASNYEIQ